MFVVLASQTLLPRLLRLGVGVGVDGSRVGEGGNSRVGVWRVRRGRVLRHNMWLRGGGGGVGGRGGGGGGRQVEVERGGGCGGDGGRSCRGEDPLQDHVWVELGLGAVNTRHGGFEQTLLTPVGHRGGGEDEGTHPFHQHTDEQ